MAKFVVVKEAPSQLEKGDYLIDKPSFLEEIKLHSTKRPRNGLTGSHYIRMVTDSIAQKYDPENMTAYSIKAHQYEGLPIPTDEDFDKVIVRALQNDYPAVFQKYLDYKIRNRPNKVERIVYVDSKISFQYETFYRNGFAEEEIQQPKKTLNKNSKTKVEDDSNQND